MATLPDVWFDRLADGDQHTAEELFPIVYDELRRLARGQMRGQPAGSTLQTTALVHEAWIRLAGHLEEPGERILHFRALAARAMRSVLVDHARAKGATKRGGDQDRVTLADGPITQPGSDVVLDLHDALERLHALDAPLARIAELRCFSGLEHQEIATLLGVSTKTAERRWRAARAWLQREIEPD